MDGPVLRHDAAEHVAPARPARRANGRRGSAQQHAEAAAVHRRDAALDAYAQVIAAAGELTVPEPVTGLPQRRGAPPRLPARAYELARQVYYLQHGSMADAARAVIAAGLSDTDEFVRVKDRLLRFWQREGWPKRDPRAELRIRDANHDGGLFRGELCAARTLGNGRAPAGKPCDQTALADSVYCPGHDPRPEYAQARARTGRQLAARRAGDLVDVTPFVDWCEITRQRLLDEARSAGRRVPAHSAGWNLLAAAMDISPTVLWRVIHGRHNRTGGRIRARTVQRYVTPLGANFRDIYGFDAPQLPGERASVCACGAPKNRESRTCRACYEAARGAQCTYVRRDGSRCPQRTTHPSGICPHCRRITEYVPRPKLGRRTWVTPVMLALALDEYARNPVIAWIAARMWDTDAGGVRGVFKDQRSLTSALVKRLRKLGVTGPDTADGDPGRAGRRARAGELAGCR